MKLRITEAAQPHETLQKLRRRRQRERLKHNRFYEQNNNVNSARASCFFVNFFSVPEQLQREMTKC